jgi:ABC-type phosphate/phosphonate transport system substrate-binding protein
MRRWFAVLICSAAGAAQAASFSFAVQPIQSPAKTREAFQPLVSYLAKATGHEFKLATNTNFLVYWQNMRQGQYDLAFDAAHFTDYRIQKMGYTVLAKVPGNVSLSLVSAPGADVLDPKDLAGKGVAVQPIPSVAALALNRWFTGEIMRRPRLIEALSSEEAAALASEGKAVAAMIPTPMASQFPKLTLVTSTEPLPGLAISASGKVPADVRQAVSAALINAGKSPDGQKMLKDVNLSGFEPASAETYKGYEAWLKGQHGY